MGTKLLLAALATCTLAVAPASADTISNPFNTYSLGNLCGAIVGGCQTQYMGQSFTASITGELTNFQFTLNSSNLASLYGVVYAWNGSSLGAELWRSANVAGTAGLLSFDPTGVQLTQGQSYVAFLSTYGIAGNSGTATLGTCYPFANCTSNAIPNLGTYVQGTVYPGSGVSFTSLSYVDATFSATITPAAVPEASTWAMLIAGLGAVGASLRRKRMTVSFA